MIFLRFILDASRHVAGLQPDMVIILSAIVGVLGLLGAIKPTILTGKGPPDQLSKIYVVSVLYFGYFPTAWRPFVARITGAAMFCVGLFYFLAGYGSVKAREIDRYAQAVLFEVRRMKPGYDAMVDPDARWHITFSKGDLATLLNFDMLEFFLKDSPEIAAESLVAQVRQTFGSPPVEAIPTPQPQATRTARARPPTTTPSPTPVPQSSLAPADVLLDEARAKWLEGDYKSSLALAGRALKIRQRYLGENDPRVIEVQKMIESAKRKMSEQNKRN